MLRKLLATTFIMGLMAFGVVKAEVTPTAPEAKAGTTILLIVCEKSADQGALDQNGFPVDGFKLDMRTCKKVFIELYNQEDPSNKANMQLPNFSVPIVCARMSMGQSPHWEEQNQGWLVLKTVCPHADGTFPQMSEYDHGTVPGN